MRHRIVLGGNPDSRISLGLIVNQAIRRLCSAYAWNWLKAVVELSTEEGSGEIALPADFGRFDAIVPIDPLSQVQQVTVDEILAARTALTPPVNTLLWALSAGAQTVPTDLPRRVLLIAPVPIDDEEAEGEEETPTPVMTIAYYRSIGNFPVSDATTSSDTHYPAIPADMHEALYWMVRAQAALMEDTANAKADLDIVTQMVNEAIEIEKRTTPPVARRMQGTVRRGGSSGPGYPRNGINLDPPEEED